MTDGDPEAAPRTAFSAKSPTLLRKACRIRLFYIGKYIYV